MNQKIETYQQWTHLRIALPCVVVEVDVCEDAGASPKVTLRVMPDSFEIVGDAEINDIADLGVALCDLAILIREGKTRRL